MRLRLVQTRLFPGFLLLLGDKLAVQRQAFLVDFAPVVRDGRLSFNLCLVAGRQRLQQWPQSSDLLLNGIMLGLLRLPLGKFAFASVQRAASVPSAGRLRARACRALSSPWRVAASCCSAWRSSAC